MQVSEHLQEDLREVREFHRETLLLLDDLEAVLSNGCLVEEENVMVTGQLQFKIEGMSLVTKNEDLNLEHIPFWYLIRIPLVF